MGRGGLEPPTSRLSGVRSNRLSYRPVASFGAAKVAERTGRLVSQDTHQEVRGYNFGGAYRDRTDDPLLAKQVLSQLS